MYTRTRLSIIIITAVALTVAAVYAQTTVALNFFGQWNLIGSAPVTEVYLINREAIPTTVEPGQVIPLSYVILNEEGEEKTYQYTIGVRRAAATTSPLRILQHGSAVVPNHETAVIHLDYTVGTTIVPVTVSFSLIHPSRELHTQIPRAQ